MRSLLAVWITLALLSTATANEHLLISEVCFAPKNDTAVNSSEFVEVFNPTDQPVDLSTVYVTNLGRSYGALPALGEGINANGVGWLYRFPAGSTLPAGAVAVICNDADIFATEFFGGAANIAANFPGPLTQLFQTNPGGLSTVVKMTSVGFSPAGLSLNNAGDLVVVFGWDGLSDRVTDLDMVLWGATISKLPTKHTDHAAGIDGPDADSAVSTYQEDPATTTTRTAPTPPPLGSGYAIARSSLIEGGETVSGGNGVTDHQETTEDWSLWFHGTATPGTTYLGRAELVFVPQDLDFGSVPLNTKSTRSLAIKNVGLQPLVIGSVQVGGSNASAFAAPAASLTIAPGSQHDLNVEFTATTAGKHDATLTLPTNDPRQRSATVKLLGAGLAPPRITIQLPSGHNNSQLEYQPLPIGFQASLDLTVGNAGSSDLLVSSIQITGPQAGDFDTSAAGMTVATGQSVVRQIAFTPQAVGRREATLTISSNDPQTATQTITLIGEALPPLAPVAQPTTTVIEFGTVAPRSSATRAYNVHNGGSALLSLEVSALLGPSAQEFSIAPSQLDIEVGETGVFTLTFGPSETGDKHARILLTTNDPQNNQLDLHVRGRAAVTLAGAGTESGGSSGGCQLATAKQRRSPGSLPFLPLAALGCLFVVLRFRV